MINNYEVHRRVAAMNMVEEDGKIWMALLYRNGFCEVDMEKKTAKMCRMFDENPLYKDYLYSNVGKVKEYLIFAPAMSERIAIYNIKTDSMRYISLKRIERDAKESKEEAKFWNIIQCQSGVYLLGYSYPAIIRIDIDSMKVTYITDWVEAVEECIEKGDGCGYFSDGYIFCGDQVLIPVGCTNAILKLDLKSNHTELMKLPIPVKGIGGIDSIDGECVWIVGKREKANNVFCWNIRTDKIREYHIDDVDENITDPFCAPVCTDSKVLLLPISADYIYEIDINTGKISRSEILEKQIGNSSGLWPWRKTMAQRLKGNVLSFITGDNFEWHEYNTLTGEKQDYFIFIEEDIEETEKYFSAMYSEQQKDHAIIRESNMSAKYFVKRVLAADRGEKSKQIKSVGEKIYEQIYYHIWMREKR